LFVASLADHFFQLMVNGVERIAQGDMDVFVRGVLSPIIVHNVACAWHRHINVEMEKLALGVGSMGKFHHHTATGQSSVKFFDFIDAVLDFTFDRIGMVASMKTDLDGNLHCCSPTKYAPMKGVVGRMIREGGVPNGQLSLKTGYCVQLEISASSRPSVYDAPVF